jgi:hypothetical protein
MKRNDFGLWGLELSPEDFARALSALGVFEGSQQGLLTSVPDIKRQLSPAAAQSEGLLRWCVSRELLEKLAKLKEAGAARAFAQAWEEFRKSYKEELRFELHLDRTDEYFWIAEQLLGSAVGATSLYVRVDEPQITVGWNWPLRIGFLDDDASGQLRQGLEKAIKKSELKLLADFVSLKSERDDCDLLLFPQTLQGALSELLKASWNPRADCVLVLGGSKDLSGRLTALLQAVRSQARTSGVGLLSIQGTQRAEWLKSLISQLSHNNPLDVALFNANREMKAAPPLLAASRRLIDLTLVSRTAARIGQALKRKVAAAPPPPAESPIIPLGEPPRRRSGSKGSPRGESKSMPAEGSFESVELPFESVGPPPGGAAKRSRPPSGGATKKNGGSGLPPESMAAALEVAGELESALPPDNWKFESAGATAMATHSRKAESLSKEIPRKAEERRIKTQIFDATSGKEQKSALKPDTSYAVDVSIALPDKKGVSADKPFAIEELPPSETGHTLTVVFTVLSGKPAQPVAEELFLPPEGPTNIRRFYFYTDTSLNNFRARITVLHRNRVIQTAILEAPVSATGRAKKGEKQTVKIEAPILPNFNDLQQRQDFDTALVFDRTDDGKVSAMTASGTKASMFSFDDAAFKETINDLNSQLTQIAVGIEFPEDIGVNPTTTLLNTLAQHGRNLHRHLFEFNEEENWPLGPDKDKIQVVSTRRDSNFPLEFLYDYNAPNDDAALCTFAKASLPKGKCDDACPGKNNIKFVCPLGFWGLNRVIERHSFDRSLRLDGGTYGLTTASDSERKPLQVLDKALFAASARVDEGESKGMIDSVKTVLKEKTKKTIYVKSWDDWTAKIKAESPSLLVLLSHTQEAQDVGEMRALEISKDDKRKAVQITKEYVINPDSQTRPLVMLVGCSTHAADNRLENFVTFFGQYAAVVISTGATVLALQAAKVAMEFIQTLSQLSGKPGGTSFGDVMLDVRRRLLAKGLPMVLCLEAYGDADWYLK